MAPDSWDILYLSAILQKCPYQIIDICDKDKLDMCCGQNYIYESGTDVEKTILLLTSRWLEPVRIKVFK
jgi:hypothetical protein